MKGKTTDNAANAVLAWGEPVPDWVAILAERCDVMSQRRVASILQVSVAMVSTVLRNKYQGDMPGIENSVRGAFMNAMVICPVLGEIPTNDCQFWQRKSAKFVNINAQRVMMFRACSRCPKNIHRKLPFKAISNAIETEENSHE
jgi:hypothetical protein